MIREQSRITQGQLTFFILQTQIGTGILSLAHDVQSVAKGGGWISVLIAGIAAQLIILVMWALLRRFPSSTVFDFASRITGRFLGKAIALAYIAFFLVVGGTVLVRAVGIINKWMLTDTPRWALVALVAVTAVYLARENIRTIVRFYVLVSLLIPVFFFLISYGYPKVDYFNYFLPVQEAGWGNIVKGAREAVTAMYGFEMLLVVYPFVEGKDGGKWKAASSAVGLVTLFYAYVTISCLIFFAPEEIALTPEPVLFMLKTFQVPVVDRADLIFLAMWFPNVAASIISYIYASANGLGYLFHRGNHKKAVLYAALICSAIALIPQTPADVDTLSKMVDKVTYVFIGGLPLLLLLLAILWKKKGERTL
ncbi:GerAB/ArcD/ProY family transporter [Desmospora profundinema]|uniref:Spore germination protein (Amino acid permease) n=1 Tax=Desmospora profundinema TaxID=1571184 RepID=A0ABU1IL05_9BACL|nr:GerAB/ArcD/ProY family transporter [Desmospora profundinema]MDR6225467.1 spore germination protein (amino acid permease) [Desmospora profundinema]